MVSSPHSSWWFRVYRMCWTSYQHVVLFHLWTGQTREWYDSRNTCSHFVFRPHGSELCLEVLINKQRMFSPGQVAMGPLYLSWGPTPGCFMILLPQGEETIGRQEGRKEGRTGGREEGQEEGRCVYVLGIWAEVIDLLITRKCYVRSSLYGIQGSPWDASWKLELLSFSLSA